LIGKIIVLQMICTAISREKYIWCW